MFKIFLRKKSLSLPPPPSMPKAKEEIRHDCEKDGHLYEILEKVYYIDDATTEVPKPTRTGRFYLECSNCKKRLKLEGTWICVDYLWENNIISNENWRELRKKISDYLDEKWNDYKKSLKKPKRGRPKKKKGDK